MEFRTVTLIIRECRRSLQIANKSSPSLSLEFQLPLFIVQFWAYEKTNHGLTLEFAELVYDVLEKPSMTSNDKLKFVIFKRIVKPELEHANGFRPSSTTNSEEPHPQEGDTTELEPPKADNDDSFTSTTAPETEFDIEKFRSNNRALSKELLFISGDTNSAISARASTCHPQETSQAKEERAET
ncbi:hypothetical protein ACTXT7_000288 [Hymenolepis weldensis]